MQLKKSWPLPSFPKPIVIIGAGGIVNDAHIPAYRKANFDVIGLYDVVRKKALHTAKKWGLKSYTSLDGFISDAEENEAIFDLATPPSAIQGILKIIPVGSTVLIQKPMGEEEWAIQQESLKRLNSILLDGVAQQSKVIGHQPYI